MSKSKQTTLDGFFINNNKKTDDIKTDDIKKDDYFYLIWENKFKPNKNAYWTNKRPEKINFIEKVSCNYIKKGYYFYICGYFSDYDDKYFSLDKEKIYKNIPYLKSHLQKSIRKQNGNLTVQTCYHLIKLNLNELLRRLPIIMMEDVSLHKSFTTLIWLMVANSTNKFKIKKYIYEWLLGCSYILCKINIKDEINYEINDEIDEINENKSLTEILDKYKKLDKNEYSILYSIYIRVAYGGTDNDMTMLKKYANVWYKRFIDKILKPSNIKIIPISIYIKDMDINTFDISAIDFHCNSKLLDFISKKYDNIEIIELKKIIWHHSSNINTRVKPYEYNIKIWNEIKNYVGKTQKYLLDGNY